MIDVNKGLFGGKAVAFMLDEENKLTILVNGQPIFNKLECEME